MSSAPELEELERELIACKGVPSSEQLIKYLRLIRELKIRDSEMVARYGSLLLKHHRSALGEEELWLLHEQVAIASLDSGAYAYAAPLIKAIANQFPKATRTTRLQGMYLEATGHVDEALELYKDVLQSKPGDDTIPKRLVALEKTKGNLPGAVEALRKYLDVWPGDVEAWEEAAEMYLQMLMYKQALFCYEELIMFNPANVAILVKYADILYTTKNYRMARSYYAKAVEASQGRSARAMFGILSCYANISENVTLQDSRSRAQIELPELTAQALIKLYRKYAPQQLPLLEPMLRQQGLMLSGK